MDNIKVLEKVEPFNDIYYIYCFYSSLFPVIKSFNRDIAPVIANEISVYCYFEDINNINLAIKNIPEKSKSEILDEIGIVAHTLHESRDIIKDIVASIDS